MCGIVTALRLLAEEPQEVFGRMGGILQDSNVLSLHLGLAEVCGVGSLKLMMLELKVLFMFPLCPSGGSMSSSAMKPD